MDSVKQEIRQALLGDLIPMDGKLAVSGYRREMFRNGLRDGFGSVLFLGVMCRKRWYMKKKNNGNGRFLEQSLKAMQNMGRIMVLQSYPDAQAVYCSYLLNKPAILTLLVCEDGTVEAAAYSGRGIGGFLSIVRTLNRLQREAEEILERLSEESEYRRLAAMRQKEYEEKLQKKQDKERKKEEKKEAKKEAKLQRKRNAKKVIGIPETEELRKWLQMQDEMQKELKASKQAEKPLEQMKENAMETGESQEKNARQSEKQPEKPQKQLDKSAGKQKRTEPVVEQETGAGKQNRTQMMDPEKAPGVQAANRQNDTVDKKDIVRSDTNQRYSGNKNKNYGGRNNRRKDYENTRSEKSQKNNSNDRNGSAQKNRENSRSDGNAPKNQEHENRNYQKNKEGNYGGGVDQKSGGTNYYNRKNNYRSGGNSYNGNNQGNRENNNARSNQKNSRNYDNDRGINRNQ